MNNFARMGDLFWLAVAIGVLVIATTVVHVYPSGMHLPDCQEDELILGTGECVPIDTLLERYEIGVYGD